MQTNNVLNARVHVERPWWYYEQSFSLLRGRPHTRFASSWPIINTDPVNAAPENALFWNWPQGWKIWKRRPLRFRVDNESAYFLKRWRHRRTPPPLAFDLLMLRRLITTPTTTTADYMFVFVPQKILSLSCNSPCSWVWVSAAVQPHYRSTQKILVSLHSPFSSSSFCVQFLRLLSVYSAQDLCACFISSSLFLVNFKRHL